MVQTNQVIYIPKTAGEKAAVPIKNIMSAPYPWYLRLIRFSFSTFGPFFPKFAAKRAVKLFATPRKRANHKVSDEVMEQAEVFEFMYKGKILKGYSWGTGKLNVLLVHGWESRGTALRSFVPVLLEKGFRVVAFDAPAHGNSSGQQIDLVDFAGSIKAVINRIGGVYGIIAHSFGGAASVYALANLNQTKRLKRLVLIASPSRMLTAMEYFLQLIRAPKAVEKEFYKMVTNKVKLPLEELDVAKMYDRVDVEQVMVVHDKEDSVVPFSASERLVHHWPGVTFVVTEGFGHYELVKEREVLEAVGEMMNLSYSQVNTGGDEL
jgi:pimeloyl-ACP methyl ester carboxylesterase